MTEPVIEFKPDLHYNNPSYFKLSQVSPYEMQLFFAKWINSGAVAFADTAIKNIQGIKGSDYVFLCNDNARCNPYNRSCTDELRRDASLMGVTDFSNEELQEIPLHD